MAKFIKGQSGNPGGKPKALRAVEDLARTHSPKAVLALAEIVSNKREPAASRVSAATALLDRGWGKPTQRAEVEVRGDLAAALEAMRGVGTAENAG